MLIAIVCVANICGLGAIESVLSNVRNYGESKKRRCVLEWMRVLKDWDEVVLETMLVLAG